MSGVGDPVGTGLVASLSRPGGNVTGASVGAAEVAGKNVELIREVLSAARRFAVLANETDPFAQSLLTEIGRVAHSAGMEMEPVMARPGGPLDATFETITGKRVDAVFIQGSLLRKEAVELAMKHRLPLFSGSREGPALGCLMSYSASSGELYRETAVYIDKNSQGREAGRTAG